jgi:DNA polymerase
VSLDWDWETRGVVDIVRRGAYVYAQHPSTEALLASFKLSAAPDDKSPPVLAWIAAGGPLNTLLRWKRGEPCPPYVRAYVEAGGEIRAFNAAFERLIWWFVMVPRHGWPRPRLEQFRCLAVTAAAMSLPRNLDRLGAALGLKTRKDKRGRDLMKIHSIPTGFNPDGSPIWHRLADDPESLEQYHVYCDYDVLTEEEAAGRLIPLSTAEMEVYWLNERVNDRGLRIDVASAKAALSIADQAKERINRELTLTTGGYVTAVTQTTRLKEWAASQGVVMPAVDKDEVDEVLHDVEDLPANVRRALELRQEGAKPSVEKIAAMLERVSDDGRARGVYLHHGAGQTGRFSSRGVQAHNMPKYRKVFEKELEEGRLDLDLLFDFIRTGRPDVLEFMYGPEIGRPLHLLSDAVRSFIVPDPGCEFIDADYSSIEGRMAAWFADEGWKIEAFRALDRGEGYGIYELAAAGIYGIPIGEVTKQHRPVGKLAELSCQYQTGVGGIRKFARQNKVKLGRLFATLWAAADEEQREFVDKRFADRVQAHDPNTAALSREGWIAAELVKLGWRAKHPRIVSAWSALETAATEAALNPGTVTTALAGRVRYISSYGFLWCQLPCGRCLAYGAPKIMEVVAPWADKTMPEEVRERKLSLTVRGVDAQSEQWVRFPIYGGSLFNNLVQGAARDILAAGMLAVEAAEYPIVMHTHDEIVSEVPRGFGSVEEFEGLMCRLPSWAAGLPVAAEGWRGVRYRK